MEKARVGQRRVIQMQTSVPTSWTLDLLETPIVDDAGTDVETVSMGGSNPLNFESQPRRNSKVRNGGLKLKN